MTLTMRVRGLSLALFAVLPFILPVASLAQSGDAKSGEKANADAAKEAQRKTDEFAEAAREVNGPGGNPECVWLGRRVVGLLWRDDLDTAFRHLDLYDRFGCPGGHIQATFRCVVRQGSIDPKADPKAPGSLSARVHACWLNPQAAAAAAPPATPAAPAASGTPPK